MAEKKISVFPSENTRAPLVVVNATGNGGEDIHESSLAFQRSVREMYMRMAAVGDVTIVDCRDADDGMCAPQEVFSRILTQANGIL